MLTKSNYNQYLQCQKLLWIAKNKKELIPAPSETTKATFDQGYEVENWARKLFGKGKEVENFFQKGQTETKKYVDERLKTYAKSKWGSKIFYYSKLFKCGSCGSGVCGEERIKKSGTRYVYYRCTKYGGEKKCNEKYIREEQLIESIAKMIEENKEKDILVSKKVLREVEKINKIQKVTVGENAKDITNLDYIQYILNGGTNFERSQFLKCIEGQLLLKNGEVILSK